MHLVELTAQEQAEEAYDIGRITLPPIVLALIGNFYRLGTQTDIHRHEEIAFLRNLALQIRAVAYIYLTASTLDNTIYRLLIIIHTQSPEIGKVITYTIGDDTERDVVEILDRRCHDTIERVIDSHIATYNNDGLIAVLHIHACQALHRPIILRLYIVVLHLLQFQILLYLMPAAMLLSYSGHGDIHYPPSVHIR